MIQFVLGHKPVVIERIDPNTTVLQYLRRQAGRRGTKEGCASGDCGACTVVVAEPDLANPRLQYRAVDSCITFLTALQGKQCITVEDLGDAQGLHPVQRAMVEEHGSQCGFCTPGFVMSLFAFSKQAGRRPLSEEDILQALSGNLCRCTGYRPIVDAARRLTGLPAEDEFSRREVATREVLLGMASGPVAMEVAGQRYYSPTTATQLAEVLAAKPEAWLLAGGTDLALEVTQSLRSLGTIVDVGRVDELLRIEESDQALTIGAAVRYADVHQRLSRLYPDCDELLQRLGSLQIRNQGTLGGNLGNASPIGDMAPMLIALRGEVTLRDQHGGRRLPVEDFFTGYRQTVLRPGEFIEAVHLPKPKAAVNFRVYKVSKRIDDDISTVCGAFAMQLEDGLIRQADIAFGGMAATPKRASECERALLGQPFNMATLRAAKTALDRDFSPLSDARAGARYRSQVAANLLQRLYWELAGQAAPVRITRYD